MKNKTYAKEALVGGAAAGVALGLVNWKLAQHYQRQEVTWKGIIGTNIFIFAVAGGIFGTLIKK